MKIKLDKDTIQTTFTENIEKVVLGVFVIVFCWLIYTSMSLENYETRKSGVPRTPSKLNENVNNARAHIDQDREAPVMEAPDFPAIATRITEKIRWSDYQLPIAFSKRLYEPLQPRSDPRRLPVEQLIAASGRAAFRVNVESPDIAGAPAARNDINNVQGRRYAVITGLVPFNKQTEIFQSTFLGRGYQNEDTDQQPKYVGYTVQRAELNAPNQPVQESDWRPSPAQIKMGIGTSYKLHEMVNEQFASFGDEEADEKYVIEGLAFPLPSRADLAAQVGARPDPKAGVAWGPVVAHLPEIPLRSEDAAPGGRRPAAPRQPRGGGGWGAPVETRPTATRPGAEPEESPDFRLLRYIDFNLRPGKFYVYRFQLVMENPNYQVEEKYLVNSQSAQDQYIFTDWSVPTKPVEMPYDTKIFLGKVDPISGNTPPKTVIHVVKWREETGKEASMEISTLFRGSVANGTKLVDVDNVNFDSEAIVLDVRGGERTSRTSTRPGEALLLDHLGQLVVRSEIDDRPAVEVLKASATPDGIEGPGGGGGGGFQIPPPIEGGERGGGPTPGRALDDLLDEGGGF